MSQQTLFIIQTITTPLSSDSQLYYRGKHEKIGQIELKFQIHDKSCQTFPIFVKTIFFLFSSPPLLCFRISIFSIFFFSLLILSLFIKKVKKQQRRKEVHKKNLEKIRKQIFYSPEEHFSQISLFTNEAQPSKKMWRRIRNTIRNSLFFMFMARKREMNCQKRRHDMEKRKAQRENELYLVLCFVSISVCPFFFHSGRISKNKENKSYIHLSRRCRSLQSGRRMYRGSLMKIFRFQAEQMVYFN